MKLKELCIIIVLVSNSMVNGNRSCLESKNTAEKVQGCPHSKEEVAERAKYKSCETVVQNCTERERFKYHCVINELENALIEVCAEPYYILSGHCTEYNTVGFRIQQHYGLKCSSAEFPCPLRYISTDAYKYTSCYGTVKENITLSSTENTVTVHAMSTISDMKSQNESSGSGTLAAILIPIVVVVVVLVVIITAAIRWKRNGFVFQDDPETQPLQPLDTSEAKWKYCTEDVYWQALKNAERLRELLSKDTSENTRLQNLQGSMHEFLDAYANVSGVFVETEFSKRCLHMLRKNKIAVLVGRQGCGKTLTAIHIIKNDFYEDWEKQKVTRYEDLLNINVDNDSKLRLYIDNMLDEFLYYEKVRRWWYSLCHIFFEHVRKSQSIHLLITAKECVIKEAIEIINFEYFSFNNACFIKEGSFLLTDNEKLNILASQFDLAKKLYEYENPSASLLFENELKTKKESLVGFPLCAHLYALHHDTVTKTLDIFENPKNYVIQHIAEQVRDDETHSVKTLFLVLLFYHGQNGSSFTSRLDLKYEEDCRLYLENAVSPNFVESMQPLQFKNLFEAASRLTDRILIKLGNMFDFKHQIYLEGVSDYFFRHQGYSKVAVKDFPMDMLRSYEFPDATEPVLDALVKRFKEELTKNNIQAVLSCKMFQKRAFEQRFCEELENDSGVWHALLLNPNNSLESESVWTFWTKKYQLQILQELEMKSTQMPDVYMCECKCPCL